MEKSILKEFVSSSKKNTTETDQSKTTHRTGQGLSANDIGNIVGIISIAIIGGIALYLVYTFAGPLFLCLLYVLCFMVILSVPVYVCIAPKESINVIVPLVLLIVAVAYYNSTR